MVNLIINLFFSFFFYRMSFKAYKKAKFSIDQNVSQVWSFLASISFALFFVFILTFLYAAARFMPSFIR